MDFNLDNFLSQILYVLSGFLFGIFASRYSVLSWRTIRARGIFASLLQVCILLIAFIAFPLLFSTRTVMGFIAFPLLFSTRTVMGSFVYYAVLLFFFSKGYNKR